MEFDDDGGMFMLEVPSVGRDVSVKVPWAVAADGWRREGGDGEPETETLHDWLQDNEARLSAMVTSRLDPEGAPATGPDDPRVLAVDALRHI